MSTLLKKKYCQERWSSDTIKACVGRGNKSNDVGLSTSGKVSDLVLTMTMVPISASPVSVTVSNDDDSAQTSIAQMAITENIECLDTTNGSCGIKRKSVRFSDNNMASIDNDFSELVHKYRTDIWYTREEYRKFWNDRVGSVRLWKCLFDENDVRSTGVLGTNSDFVWEGKKFTVRGLENYIFSSSEAMNRQRDLYNVAVLQDPYDVDGTLAYVCDLSRASLQRAQQYALHDAIDAYEDGATVPVSHHVRDTRSNLQYSSTPPRSPSSVLPMNNFHQSLRSLNDPPFNVKSIREMNKRLIRQHLNDSVYQNLAPNQKKRKRRSSTSGSYVSAHEPNLPYPQRRHSTSLLPTAYRQPVSLQTHNFSTFDRQRRRPSIADDFSQHMQFCNRLLNDLPIVDHSPCRRDSLSLAGNDLNQVPDRVESFDRCNNLEFTGNEDEYLLPPQIRRDSSCALRRRLHTGSVDEDRSMLRQMMLVQEQQQASFNDSALNEYANCIRGYSRLRRDSLGGNFGM